jgi:hypothetical protein
MAQHNMIAQRATEGRLAWPRLHCGQHADTRPADGSGALPTKPQKHNPTQGVLRGLPVYILFRSYLLILKCILTQRFP